MRRAYFVAALFFLVGCASTQVVESWKNPDFQGTLQFKKVIVMAIAKDESTRRIAEDELAAFIGTDKAAPSHKFVATEDLKNADKVKAALKANGADGLVVVRYVDTQQEINYSPGMVSAPYYSPWNYQSMAWGRVAQTGYITTDTIVRLETNIYSIPDEKLIWSGASETFNPGNIHTETKAFARTIQAKLKKDKLLADTESAK